MISLNDLWGNLLRNIYEQYGIDELVLESSNGRNLCHKIQWVLPKITSYNTCLHLMCPISVTNGMFSTPPWAINSDQAHVNL